MSLLTDAIEILDRQHAYVAEQTDPTEFFLAMREFISVIESTPSVRDALADARAAQEARLTAANSMERDCVARMVSLRTMLVQLDPTLDDSRMECPEDDVNDGWLETLASFDRIVRTEPKFAWAVLSTKGLAGEGRPHDLLRILRNKARLLKRGADTTAFREALEETHRDYKRLWRELQIDSHLLGGVAFLRVQKALHRLNPPRDKLYRFEEEADETAVAKNVLDGNPTAEERRLFKSYVDDLLRPAVTSLYRSLRRGLGTTRSRLALVQRFKDRCQRHDAVRLRGLAVGGRPEDSLRDELARFLFDQGLNPVTETMVGMAKLRPDILEHARPLLYVEAKQYETKESAKKAIIKGARQVWSTVNQLRGEPYDVREAFLVVFRRDGPLCHLPLEPIHSEGVALYVLTIDIAEAKKAGSRERENPIVVTALELSPEAVAS